MGLRGCGSAFVEGELEVYGSAFVVGGLEVYGSKVR